MSIKIKMGSWAAAAMLATLCLTPASAFAEGECTTDSDCGEHFICSMSTAPCPAPMPCDSADGAECPEPVACEPQAVGYCQPAPPEACDSAADCDAGLVCVTYTYEICSGADAPSCAPTSESCPEPREQTDADCSTETEGICLPPYLAPCDAAADCGEGFECKAQEVCSCSGGSGGIIVEPGAPDGGEEGSGEGSSEVPIDDCSCEPGDVKYCDLIQQECDSDAECAGELVCAELPGGNVSSPDTTCATGPDGTTVCEDHDFAEDEADATSYCLPADLDRWIGGGGYPGGAQDDSANYEHGPYQPGGQGSSVDGDTRDVVATSVDRGNAALGGDADSGCGCASTQSSLPGSFAALVFALLGMVGLRCRWS